MTSGCATNEAALSEKLDGKSKDRACTCFAVSVSREPLSHCRQNDRAAAVFWPVRNCRTFAARHFTCLQAALSGKALSHSGQGECAEEVRRCLINENIK